MKVIFGAQCKVADNPAKHHETYNQLHAAWLHNRSYVNIVWWGSVALDKKDQRKSRWHKVSLWHLTLQASITNSAYREATTHCDLTLRAKLGSPFELMLYDCLNDWMTHVLWNQTSMTCLHCSRMWKGQVHSRPYNQNTYIKLFKSTCMYIQPLRIGFRQPSEEKTKKTW